MPRWTEQFLRLTLRGGSVFYLQHRGLTSPQPHYFVVLNRRPFSDPFLAMVVASSKVEAVRRRRAGLPAESLLEVAPGEFGEFSVPTVLDCHVCFRVSLAELLVKLESGVAIAKAQMSESLLSRLRTGVLASPLVEGEVKAMLAQRPAGA